jgi:hypothetical protein
MLVSIPALLLRFDLSAALGVESRNHIHTVRAQRIQAERKPRRQFGTARRGRVFPAKTVVAFVVTQISSDFVL